MNVRFLTLAQQEVDEAFIWFDERTDSKGVTLAPGLEVRGYRGGLTRFLVRCGRLRVAQHLSGGLADPEFHSP